MCNELYNICHELFYVSEDGLLIRKKRTSPNAPKGEEAGNFDKSLGYKRVKINRKSYLTHRIIYLMSYGYLPDLVDHIDGNTLNNKPDNLREAKKIENRWNSSGNKILTPV